MMMRRGSKRSSLCASSLEGAVRLGGTAARSAARLRIRQSLTYICPISFPACHAPAASLDASPAYQRNFFLRCLLQCVPPYPPPTPPPPADADGAAGESAGGDEAAGARRLESGAQETKPRDTAHRGGGLARGVAAAAHLLVDRPPDAHAGTPRTSLPFLPTPGSQPPPNHPSATLQPSPTNPNHPQPSPTFPNLPQPAPDVLPTPRRRRSSRAAWARSRSTSVRGSRRSLGGQRWGVSPRRGVQPRRRVQRGQARWLRAALGARRRRSRDASGFTASPPSD